MAPFWQARAGAARARRTNPSPWACAAAAHRLLGFAFASADC
ncbi:MAG TPA: hypothetical protein VGG29_11315 [Caulobacteraceae bacterium]